MKQEISTRVNKIVQSLNTGRLRGGFRMGRGIFKGVSGVGGLTSCPEKRGFGVGGGGFTVLLLRCVLVCSQ
jgi:hypothetical protein